MTFYWLSLRLIIYVKNDQMEKINSYRLQDRIDNSAIFFNVRKIDYTKYDINMTIPPNHRTNCLLFLNFFDSSIVRYQNFKFVEEAKQVYVSL